MSRFSCLAGAMLCAVLFSACTVTDTRTELAPGTVTFFVSPSGSDAWSGKSARPNRAQTDGPFQTVARARDAIRALKTRDGSLRHPVTVLLDNGLYGQREALSFGPEDSGTEACPITYAARPGCKPVISGGLAVKNWQRDTGGQSRDKCGGNLLSLRLPENPAGTPWAFNQLYVNGESRTRARSPNKGSFFRSAGPTGVNETREFFFNEGDVKNWRNLRQALFTVYHSWETSLHHVHAIDAENGVVTFREPSPWPMGHWEKQQRYYVEGIFEGLDQPGEWYLDPSDNTLYYYPLPDETPRSLEAVVPLVSSTLVAFNGVPSQNAYVEHLRFRGIAFRHTDANLSLFRNAGQGEIYQPALIMATGLRHAAFEQCEISCAGAHALWLAAGSSDNTVRQCQLHALGGGGVYIGGGWGVSETAPAASNTVDNCFIHNAGNLFHGAHGVWIGKSSYNTITHNEISNLDYSGISCGWSWGFQPTSAHHNIIDFNHIHHLSNGEGLNDMGGIYTLGVSPGTTERYNHVHDVYSYEHVSYGSGLYPDEGSSDILLANNVVHHVRSSALFMHYGADCTVSNNVLALGGKGPLRRSREDKRCHYNAVCNIVYSDHPQMLDGPWKNKDWHLAGNLYWSTAGEPQFAGRTFAEWQAEGNDTGSLVADPLFKDPAAGDFTLKAGSPALKAGFRPIDLSHTGLYGDRAWTSLPGKYPDRKRVEIAKPVEAPIAVNYTFEDLAPGTKPYDCALHEEGGAMVAVTDERAAEGTQCLKFQDAPGAHFRWLPHLEYKRTFTNGTVTLSWDMLNSKEQPDTFIVELRDYSQGSYLSGPTVSVDTDGTVKASGQAVAKMPLGEWVKATVDITLGKEAPATYRLQLDIPGQQRIVKTLPVSNKSFKAITWLGLMSNSDANALFYVDNLRMGTPEELATPPPRRRRAHANSRKDRPSVGKDGLAGYWNFEGDTGYTVPDLSGCGNTGDLWARPATGAFGHAAYCDDTASHIQIPDSPSLHVGKEPFSLSLWLCPETLESKSADARRRFISKNGHPSTWWNMNLTSDGKISLELADSEKHHFGCTSNAGLPLKRWSHLAVVIDRSARDVRFYINGKPDASRPLPASFTGSLDVAGQDLYLGSTWQPLTGLLDEVKLYKRGLTAAEIAADYAAQHARYAEASYRILE